MENLYEPSKRICLKAITVLCFAAAFFSFLPRNSKLLFPAVEGNLPATFFECALSLCFVFLGISSIIMNTAVSDGKKLMAIKSKMGNFQSFYEERDFYRNLSKQSRKMYRKNVVNAVISAISVVLVLVVFIFAEVGYVIMVENKPEINRVAENLGGYRLYMDLFTYFALVVGIVGFFLTTPFIIRNRRVSKVAALVFMAFDIVSLVHLTYFFMGNITSYPSMVDGLTALLCLVFALLCWLGIMTDEKKKLLSGWNDTNINIYEFGYSQKDAVIDKDR